MRYRKSILSLALPAMGENVLQMLMGTLDTYLVAQLGVLAVSGVSVANNLMTIYQAIFIGLATAGSAYLARQQGNRKKIDDQPTDIIAQTLGLTIWVGLGLGLFSLFLGAWTLARLGLEGQVLALGSLYLGWVGGWAILTGLMTSLSGLIRVQGLTKTPLVVSLAVNALNLTLSASLLYLTPLGLAGIALGTILARLIGVGLLWQFLKHRPALRQLISLNHHQILGLSLPLIGERLMMRLGDLAVVSLIVGLGTTALAGQALGETLIQFHFMPALALATATVILTAQYHDETAALHQLLREIYGLGILLMLSIGLPLWLLAPFLLGRFTGDSAVIQEAQIIVTGSLLGIPVTVGTQVMAATWQGLGQSKLPLYATTIGMWLVRVLLGYLLIVPLGLGLWGVALATNLDNLWRSLFLLWRFQQKGRADH